jgi:hypothetical protein
MLNRHPGVLRSCARTTIAASALVVLASVKLPAGAARGGDDARATIEGQMFDEDGRPLEGMRVTAIEVGSGSPLDALRRELAEREVTSVETDPGGLFRFDVSLPQASGRLVIRCFDEEGWDDRRYDPPLDVDVTREVRERGRAVVNCRVADAPFWTEKVYAAGRAGGSSTERGRILSRHGMPPEVVTRLGGTIEWRYPRVTYVFEGGKLVETIERDGENVEGRAAR